MGGLVGGGILMDDGEESVSVGGGDRGEETKIWKDFQSELASTERGKYTALNSG